MRTWRQLSQTAARLHAKVHGGADGARITDADEGDALVTVSIGVAIDPRDADRVLRAAVEAALIQLRRLEA